MDRKANIAAPTPVASIGHTTLLVIVLLAAAVTPSASPRAPAGHPWLGLLLVEMVLAAYVAIGLRDSRRDGRALLGRWPPTAGDVLRGIGVGATLLGLTWVLQRFFPDTSGVALHPLQPVTPLERIVWVVLAAVVASSEELVFRGYLQRQLQAAGAGFWIATTLQAALFGAAHASQGWLAAVRYGLYGLVLGYLAHRRQGLTAPVLAHFTFDLAASF